MNDRINRLLLAVVALSLATLALQSFRASAPDALAQGAKKRCYWTWVGDDGKPDLGKDGEIELKSKDWQKVSAEGWQLKAIHEHEYIFEKCEVL